MTFVICDWGVDKAVEIRKAVHKVPHGSVVGMEDMRAVNMNVDTLHIIRIYIAGNMRPLIYHQHRLSGIHRLPSEYRAI